MVTCGSCGHQHECAQVQLTCCGQPMLYQDFFGIRRYSCVHRDNHPAIYVDLATGQSLSDMSVPYMSQET
jgi:hypothetical protein